MELPTRAQQLGLAVLLLVVSAVALVRLFAW